MNEERKAEGYKSGNKVTPQQGTTKLVSQQQQQQKKTKKKK
jgi:hypothetical protein